MINIIIGLICLPAKTVVIIILLMMNQTTVIVTTATGTITTEIPEIASHGGPKAARPTVTGTLTELLTGIPTALNIVDVDMSHTVWILKMGMTHGTGGPTKE